MNNYPLYLELLSLRPAQYNDILTVYLAYEKLSADWAKSEFLKPFTEEKTRLIKDLKQAGDGLDLLLAVAVDQFPQLESYASVDAPTVKRFYRCRIQQEKAVLVNSSGLKKVAT